MQKTRINVLQNANLMTIDEFKCCFAEKVKGYRRLDIHLYNHETDEMFRKNTITGVDELRTTILLDGIRCSVFTDVPLNVFENIYHEIMIEDNEERERLKRNDLIQDKDLY